MSLDETAETDVLEEINGIQVAFDEMIYAQTKGLTWSVRKRQKVRG
ncbi:MAG: hypothetical protein LRY73_15500 [Bacillus sp. (in: Bacteria)]|nr:hypothetical protein [Bacillus sp. (in: firmicutes)]